MLCQLSETTIAGDIKTDKVHTVHRSVQKIKIMSSAGGGKPRTSEHHMYQAE